MLKAFIGALILLPGTVLVLVPAVILMFTGIEARFAEPTLAGIVCFWSGFLSATAGIGLAFRCSSNGPVRRP